MIVRPALRNAILLLFFYVGVGAAGIITTAIFADQRPLNPGPTYTLGITITLVLMVLAFFSRRSWDQACYGTKVTVDLKTYKVPSLCPETGRHATELRVAQFAMTGGVVTMHGGFPVMLSPEGAASFDKRLLPSVNGLRVVRSDYNKNKITLYVKDEAYLRAMREANQETGAVSV